MTFLKKALTVIFACYALTSSAAYAQESTVPETPAAVTESASQESSSLAGNTAPVTTEKTDQTAQYPVTQTAQNAEKAPPAEPETASQEATSQATAPQPAPSDAAADAPATVNTTGNAVPTILGQPESKTFTSKPAWDAEFGLGVGWVYLPGFNLSLGHMFGTSDSGVGFKLSLDVAATFTNVEVMISPALYVAHNSFRFTLKTGFGLDAFFGEQVMEESGGIIESFYYSTGNINCYKVNPVLFIIKPGIRFDFLLNTYFYLGFGFDIGVVAVSGTDYDGGTGTGYFTTYSAELHVGFKFGES